MLQKELSETQLEMRKELVSLSEDQIIEFKKAYREREMPNWRYYSLIGFNVLTGAGMMYYTLNFKHYQRKFFRPKDYSLREMIKFGTIQSSLFVGFYCLGIYVVSGFWSPVKYVREMSTIDGFVVDQYLKSDPVLQEHFLINTMNYFGLSQGLIEQAKHELRNNDMSKQGFYTKQEQTGLYKRMMDRRNQDIHKDEPTDLKTRKNDDDI